MRPLIAVLGPTGSGKSTLAVELALEFGGEVVNCDSVQIYRHLDIGTAKIPVADRRGIPHHLIDILDPDRLFTAGDYVQMVRPLLDTIPLPIVAGGTGLYFRALLLGLFDGPTRDETLRTRLAQRSPEALHRLLHRFDPDMSGRIHPNDVQKVTRALEVCFLARAPISSLHGPHRKALEGYSILKIGLNPEREQLVSHLNQRVSRMFTDGLIDEVQSILRLGYSPQAKALESIGYREALLHITGELSLSDAIAQTQAASRQYAKRQRTWFRREPGVRWLDGFGNQAETIQNAKSLVRKAHQLE